MDRRGIVSISHLIEHSAFGDVCEISDLDLHKRDQNYKMQILALKIERINPDFVSSIRKNGILLPVKYDPTSDRLINGHHRVAVAWLLGIEEIPFDLDGEGDDWDLPQGELEDDDPRNPSHHPNLHRRFCCHLEHSKSRFDFCVPSCWVYPRGFDGT